MGLNSDFGVRAAVHSADIPWVASPMPGVDRRMLDRIGDEVARATSIVRYAPGSKFSSHVHTGGEEFLVLDGVFQDDAVPRGSGTRSNFNTGCSYPSGEVHLDARGRLGVGPEGCGRFSSRLARVAGPN